MHIAMLVIAHNSMPIEQTKLEKKMKRFGHFPGVEFFSTEKSIFSSNILITEWGLDLENLDHVINGSLLSCKI